MPAATVGKRKHTQKNAIDKSDGPIFETFCQAAIHSGTPSVRQQWTCGTGSALRLDSDGDPFFGGGGTVDGLDHTQGRHPFLARDGRGGAV